MALRPEEFYAEAYSLWLVDPDFLKTNYQVVYEFFQNDEPMSMPRRPGPDRQAAAAARRDCRTAMVSSHPGARRQRRNQRSEQGR